MRVPVKKTGRTVRIPISRLFGRRSDSQREQKAQDPAERLKATLKRLSESLEQYRKPAGEPEKKVEETTK